MNTRQVVTVVVLCALLLSFYFRFSLYERLTMEDRKCILSEWRESSYIPSTRDSGSNYTIAMADRQETFKWLHLPEGSMENQPEILIIVMSKTESFSRRNVLRRTWMNKKHSEMSKNGSMKALFLVGVGGHPGLKQAVMLEAKLHRDMVVSDLEDTYVALPFKTLSLFLYAVAKSPRTRLIGKIDDDVMFFPDLLSVLRENGEIATDAPNMYGEVVQAGLDANPDKIQQSKSIYNCPKFPSFLSGPFYLTTRNAAVKILEASKHRNFLTFEDILVTGILADDVGVHKKQLSMLNMYYNAKKGKIIVWHSKLSNDQYEEEYESQQRRHKVIN